MSFWDKVNPVKQAEKAAKEAKKAAEGAFKKGKGAANDVVKEVSDLPGDIVDQIEKAVDLALKEALSIGSGVVLGKMVKVLEATAPDAASVKIGPVKLDVDDVHERIDTLKKWGHNPPKGKSGIRKMIEEIAPSSVSIEISGEIAFVVFGSDSLGAGFSLTWKTKDFLDRFEAILKSVF